MKKTTPDGYIICHKFAETGTCTYGKKCRFAHVKDNKTINNPVFKEKRGRDEQAQGPNKKQQILTMVAEQYPEMDLEDFESKVNDVMAPTLDVQLASSDTQEPNAIWNDGLVWGVDSNASYGLTCFDKFLINKRKGQKRMVQGLGGFTLNLCSVYDAVIFVRSHDGREVILKVPVYYHPKANANVLSAIALSKLGWDLSMNHSGRNGLNSNTNSGNALIGPENCIVWLTTSGRSGAGIVTIRAADRCPDPALLPFDLHERAERKQLTHRMSQKQLRTQRAAAMMAQKQMAAADQHSETSNEHGRDTDMTDWHTESDSDVEHETKGKGKRKHVDFATAGAQ